MTNKHVIDRAGWPSGEWDSEPDRLDFIHSGFSCLLLRNNLGAWCGYVGVPEAHPDFGKEYDDVDVEVHGGLTYAGPCQGHICRVPALGMPEKVWWFGFDTAHYRDLLPRMLTYYKTDWPSDQSYKTMDYTRRETETLAEQLAERVGKLQEEMRKVARRMEEELE